ncbi:hypothetical protein LSAT2_023316, partial [Lamellibrachia satsuma]
MSQFVDSRCDTTSIDGIVTTQLRLCGDECVNVVVNEVATKVALPACFTSHTDLAFSKQKYAWRTDDVSRSLPSRIRLCMQILRLTVNDGGGEGKSTQQRVFSLNTLPYSPGESADCSTIELI